MTAENFKTELGLVVNNNILTVNASSGQVGINTGTTTCSLTIAANDAIQMPVGNTAQRPASSNGQIRYNTDLGEVEYYANGQWNQPSTQPVVQTLSFVVANTLWNVAAGSIAKLTLTANCTVANATSLTPGYYTLLVTQGVANSFITWAGQYKWPGGVAPVLTPNANANDCITFVSDGTLMIGTYVNNYK